MFSPDVSADVIRVPYIIIRKSIHFVEYAILTFLLFRAFRGDSPRKWNFHWAVYSGVITISYGFLDELLQTFVPTRNGSILDSLINTTGVLFVLGMMGMKAKKNDPEKK